VAMTAGAEIARDDVSLMTEIVGGDVDAFEQLYDRYYARAYRVAHSVCRERGHEDAVQEAFLSAWRSCRLGDVGDHRDGPDLAALA
jgi:DNA-directed RNA polymerase specialized sigma24 family protein